MQRFPQERRLPPAPLGLPRADGARPSPENRPCLRLPLTAARSILRRPLLLLMLWNSTVLLRPRISWTSDHVVNFPNLELLPPLVRLLQRHARHLFAVMPQRILLLSGIPPRLATSINRAAAPFTPAIHLDNKLPSLVDDFHPPQALLPSEKLAPSQFKGAVQPITEAGQGHTRFIYNDAGTHIASKSSPRATLAYISLEFQKPQSHPGRSWFL